MQVNNMHKKPKAGALRSQLSAIFPKMLQKDLTNLLVFSIIEFVMFCKEGVCPC